MMINRLTNKIPAWSVTVFGASMVVVSTLIGTLALRNVDHDIQTNSRRITQLNASIQKLWDSHKLADLRAGVGDILAGLIVHVDRRPHPFLLGRAGGHVEGAILAMWAATGDTTDATDLKCQVNLLRTRLNDGELDAYDSLSDLVNAHRHRSAEAINDRSEQVRQHEERIRSLRLWYNMLQNLQISFNILGLVIVLLKDLPVWRSAGRKQNA